MFCCRGCVVSYESMKSVCDRYNRALDSLLQLVCDGSLQTVVVANVRRPDQMHEMWTIGDH